MNQRQRENFDRQLDWVLKRLPAEVRERIEEVPLVVEDRPSRRIMEEAGIEFPEELAGWYAGTPLDARGPEVSQPMPDVVMLFREGITAAAVDERGRVTNARLREEIRITILHEIGHHHGIDEDELDDLGYG